MARRARLGRSLGALTVLVVAAGCAAAEQRGASDGSTGHWPCALRRCVRRLRRAGHPRGEDPAPEGLSAEPPAPVEQTPVGPTSAPSTPDEETGEITFLVRPPYSSHVSSSDNEKFAAFRRRAPERRSG
jgi:hypothetical protein